MLEKLHIKHFRCFEEFSIEKLTRINLISGKNNVGKTALLEAIFLFFGYKNPDIFIKTSMLRGVLLTSFSPDVTWEHLFYNKDMDSAINISILDNEKEFLLTIQKDRSFALSNLSVPINQEIRPLSGGYPLKISFKFEKNLDVGHIVPLQNAITATWKNPIIQTKLPIVQYIGINNDNTQSLVFRFGQVEKSGKKNILINILQKLDADLEDLTTIVDESPRLYAKKKNGPLLPLAAMGNGLSRLLQILCAMLEKPNGIILIDEIEAGFHFSFMPKLWEAIEKLANEMDVQIFATTHSLECLHSLLDANVDKKNITYTRLGKVKETIRPFHFNGEELDYAISQNMEIR